MVGGDVAGDVFEADREGKWMTHCRECQYGRETTEQGRHWGWSCHHPEITKQRSLMYGRFHQREKFTPKWCPEKIADESTVYGIDC